MASINLFPYNDYDIKAGMPNYLKRILFSKFLEDGETLFYTLHRHWILVWWKMAKITILGILLPLFLAVSFIGELNEATYFLLSWAFIGFLYSLHTFFDWYMDAWLLTDVSIIDVQWDGFFNQRSSRIDYESIESIDYDIQGFEQSILGYGQLVLIKVSGVNAVVEEINNPEKASHYISRIRTELYSTKKNQDSEAIKELLAEIISERISLVD